MCIRDSANVITKSGKAVETAGDIDTLLLDKTGTITIGNRKAPERESCRNNTLISGYISDVHCIVNRINRWSDLLHRLFSY